MRSVLIHAELWDIVSGTKSAELTQEQKKQWDIKDQKALASLILCISASQINHIKNCSCAKGAWNKLKEIHVPHGPATKVTLYKKLLNIKLAIGQQMAQHIVSFDEVLDKLSGCSIHIPEDLICLILLNSLSSEYENFVVAMETRDSLPSLSMLKIKLQEEADRRDASQGDLKVNNDGEQQAYVARANEKVKNNNVKFNGKCFKCGHIGHIAAKCKTKNFKTKRDNYSYSLINACNAEVRDAWIIDSGCTSHICTNKSMFSTYKEHVEKIKLPGNNYVTTDGCGEVIINTKSCTITLKNVLHVQNIKMNFMSVTRAVEEGFSVVFNNNFAEIKDNKNVVILRANKEDNLFIFRNIEQKCFMINNSVLWHQRFGHLNFSHLKQMVNKNMVYGLDKIDFANEKCKTCMVSKIHIQPFPKFSETRSNNVLNLIHTDICGPFPPSLNNSRYFMILIDDYSRMIFVYFLKNKSDALNKFKIFKNFVELQTGKKIKKIRSDNGREYVNSDFDNFLNTAGINRQLTVAYTPQQNGVAERANRTLIEMSRSMLIHSNSSECLWAEAVATSVYLRNRAQTRILDYKTPFEVWTGKKPNVKHLRVFGSTAVGLNKAPKTKLKPKGKLYKMVGYSMTCKAYRLYDPTTRKVIESRDVLFDENVDKSEKENNVCLKNLIIENNDDLMQSEENCAEVHKFDNEDLDDNNENNSNENENNHDLVESSNKIGRGRPRICRSGQPGRPRKMYNLVNVMTSQSIPIPTSVNEALSGPYKNEWIEAMKIEYDALVRNQTWTLVQLPENKKAIGSRWVFNVKYNKSGNVDRFKARLVAQGFSQEYGVNFTETFSPVVRYETIRMIIALASQYGMLLHQLDISTAYLNSDLDEEVFMKQAQYFESKENPNFVLKLNKAIYGLKQSGRQWNLKLQSILEKIGFEQLKNEPCLFKKCINGNLNLIAFYVDDLLIASTKHEDLLDIKSKLAKEFKLVDKGALHHFLGMEIERDGERGAINIGQTLYISGLLSRYNMTDCRPCGTPLDPGFQTKCTSEDCKKVDPIKYQSLVGELMYIALISRPDIMHSVCKLAQFNKEPHVEHETGLKHILRYLNSTKNLKLRYSKNNQKLHGFVDADWASDCSDRKSFTGYTFMMSGAAISWSSKKQRCVALSSTEAEYVALTLATKEAVFLKRLLNEINSLNEPILLLSDNLSAQQLAKNPVYHERSKHIDIRYHFIRDIIKNKEIDLDYCSTNDMTADILTKNLCKLKHSFLRTKMGLI